jgi:hypothetical protein
MFQESVRDSIYTMRPFSNGEGPCVEVGRFTLDGSPVQKKIHPLREYEEAGFTRRKNALYSFLFETLGEIPGKMRDAFLLIHPTNPRRPEAILAEENYRRIIKMMHHIGEGIGGTVHCTNFEA